MTPSIPPAAPRHLTKLEREAARDIVTRSDRPRSPAERLIDWHRKSVLAGGIHYRNNGARYEPQR